MAAYYQDERTPHATSPHSSSVSRGLAIRQPTSPASSTLTPGQIADALAKSPDHGATLDLTHLSLVDVGESGTQVLASLGREQGLEQESPLVRVALGFNRLATLPMSFALLTRVRYLNLCNNSFAVFPDVLTAMTSLEILDIRRNKLKRFPTQPGSLINLRVLSISRNKITRLPSYLSMMDQLTTLVLDSNPIEWPPRAVMEPYPSTKDTEGMKEWVMKVQAWIEGHNVSPDGRKLSDNSVDRHEWELPSRRVRNAHHEPDFEMVATPHARSFSIDSETSTYSGKPPPSPTLHVRRDNSREGSRPPPLFLGILNSNRGNHSPSPSRSPDSYLPTPDESVTSTDEEAAQLPPLPQVHSRGPSYTPSALRNDSRSTVGNKQSLPDLRMAKFSFGTGNRVQRGIRPRTQTDLPIIPRAKQPEYSPVGSPGSRVNGALANSTRTSGATPPGRHSPTVGTERNSYFRRLSTISSSTIHTSIPQALLTIVEGIRDLMFAVTQIYDTLEYYALHAADPTLAVVLKKVLDPASAYIACVIEALDRFDSISRRTVPAPAVCRTVVTSCRDMVAGFGKAVEMLSTQLKVIATSEDKRYTRQMLLVLYGATAEVARAWTSMTKSIAAVRPYLVDHGPPHARSHNVSADLSGSLEPPMSAPATSSLYSGGKSTIPFTRTRSSLSAASGPPDSGNNSRRAARRHAGSFSVKDLELGRSMAAVIESPPLPSFAGSPSGTGQTPTPRAIPPSITRATPAATTWGGGLHDRRDSQSSAHALSSTSSSPVAASRIYHAAPEATASTFADKDAIDAVAAAVEAAPAVWEMMEEIIDELQGQPDQLRETLARAKNITETLKRRLALVRAGDIAHRTILREDAQVFVKIVVQLSSTMKTYTGTRVPPAVIAARMVRLTKETEACLMLLHVSSFSGTATPAPSSRAHTPLAPPTESSYHRASLSRSRSAAQPTPVPRTTHNFRDGPRSALPHQQNFHIISPTRAAGLASRNR